MPGIDAHSVSPPARYSIIGGTNLHSLVNMDTRALDARPQLLGMQKDTTI